VFLNFSQFFIFLKKKLDIEDYFQKYVLSLHLNKSDTQVMKKVITSFFCTLFIQSIFAQDAFLYTAKNPEYSIQFLKRIENNIIFSRLEDILDDGSVRLLCNLDSKTNIEKLFFGDINALVEFCFEPDFDAPFGFRILRDRLTGKSCLLEVKNIPNYEKVQQEVLKKYPTTGFSLERLESTPDSVLRQSAKHNNAQRQKQREERLALYTVNTVSLPVDNQFTETLYEKVVALIENFDSKQASRNKGYRVTFRYVVENEVRTLSISDEPQGDALKMINLCRQIVKDVETNNFQESKYMELK
jgi:hypothetical protein